VVRIIASRIARLRKSQHLTLDALASRSGVSKGMLVAIEQGGTNPSIGTLCKVAAALRVSLAELLTEDARQDDWVELVPPVRASPLWRGPKGGSATLLVGSSGPDMLELWEWTLYPGERFQAKPHPKGTTELLSVTEGTVAVEVCGTNYLIPAQHRAVAKTDGPHSYRCHGSKRARFSMVVHQPELP
jgi:transcriptional regulator with XRE-family HTH domain